MFNEPLAVLLNESLNETKVSQTEEVEQILQAEKLMRISRISRVKSWKIFQRAAHLIAEELPGFIVR